MTDDEMCGKIEGSDAFIYSKSLMFTNEEIEIALDDSKFTLLGPAR